MPLYRASDRHPRTQWPKRCTKELVAEKRQDRRHSQVGLHGRLHTRRLWPPGSSKSSACKAIGPNGASVSRLVRCVIPPPSPGTHTGKVMECASKIQPDRRIPSEARSPSATGRSAHQVLGMLNAVLNQPLVRGDTERNFEGTGEVADREPAFTSNLREPDTTIEVFVKKLSSPSLLPRRQTSVGTPSFFLNYAVLLQKMCAENQAQLIKSQNGRIVAPPNRGRMLFVIWATTKHVRTAEGGAGKSRVLRRVLKTSFFTHSYLSNQAVLVRVSGKL